MIFCRTHDGPFHDMDEMKRFDRIFEKMQILRVVIISVNGKMRDFSHSRFYMLASLRCHSDQWEVSILRLSNSVVTTSGSMKLRIVSLRDQNLSSIFFYQNDKYFDRTIMFDV